MDDAKTYKRQITKFGLYGLFKNLRFFDPVLLIYLYSNGLDAFHIGILYAVREIVIYLFEIPSGVFADRYGKKTELLICFGFYIISFILFALGTTLPMFVLAMILFGLGEAFRSGTHKAMILLYLDQQNRSDEKSKTYGRTRSYSMIGSTISSVFTIYLVIAFPDLRYLFFFAIIPYLLDMLLILSYPNILNDKTESTFTLKKFLHENKEALGYVVKDKKMRWILLRSSSYQAMFKILKDFIQLILVSIPITVLVFNEYSAEDHITIYSAIMYAMIFLISAVASRQSYKLLRFSHQDDITRLMWGLSGIAVLLIGVFINQLWIVFFGFVLLYVFLNLRKPIMVEIIGTYSDPSKRASVLSIDSQLTSLFIVVFAPLLGFMADRISLSFMFISVGVVLTTIYIISFLNRHPNPQSQ